MARPGVVSFRSPSGRIDPAAEEAYAAWLRDHRAAGYVAAVPAGKLHRAGCSIIGPRGRRAGAGVGRPARTLGEKLCAVDPAALRADARDRGYGDLAGCRASVPDRPAGGGSRA